jgi:acetylornithine/succinyldiaminopimelate/putrescine aminotransferase
MNSLHSLHLSKIKEIRGKGLMIGIEFNEVYQAKKIAAKMIEEGVVVGTSGDAFTSASSLLFLKEIMKFLSRFRKVSDLT